jgi:hypothetical protein
MSPEFNLALIGFTAEQRILMQAQLLANKSETKAERADDCPAWRISDYSEANALLFNANLIASVQSQTVHFQQSLLPDAIMGLQLSGLTIPYAFCGDIPAVLEALLPASTPRVKLHDKQNLVRMLQHFEAALMPLRTVYALAYQIHDRKHELDVRRAYHLDINAALCGIVDMAGLRVIMRDGLSLQDIEAATWASRPASANHQPEGFNVRTLEECMWILAMYGQEPALPARFFTNPVYLRRLPRVPSHLLYPRHAYLMELLRAQEWKFIALAAALNYDSDAQKSLLKRDLFALYVCRAITTDASRAMARSAAAPYSYPSSQPSTSVPSIGMGQLDTMPADLR